MHPIDKDKALGLGRIIEEIETYNSALLDAFVPIINDDFHNKNNFLKKVEWTPIVEKLNVLCLVCDKNVRSEDKLIAYHAFQMDQLLSELIKRSDIRSKYSVSAFVGSIYGSKKGATLVAEISRKLKESYKLWSGDEQLVLRASLKDIQDELDSQNNKNKKTMG